MGGTGPPSGVDALAVLGALQVALVVVDADGVVVYANDAARSLAGQSSGGLIGRTFDDTRWRARDRTGRLLERDEYPVARALGGELVERAELLVDTEDGGTMVLLAKATPLDDGQGAVTHVVATTHDITAATGWEAKLATSRARFAAVFEHAVEAMLLFDDDGHYLQANPAAGRLLGVEPDQLVGRHFSTIMADTTGSDERWSELMRAGMKEDLVDLVRSDGAIVTVAAESVAGVEPGVNLTVWRDVTEQRRVVEALERAVVREREAAGEQANAAALKDVFLSAVSHELRTPMAAIAGFNDTLREHGGRLDDDRARELLERQHDNIRRLEELLEDLLDLDRLKRGLGVVTREHTTLAEVVEGSVLAATEDLERVGTEVEDAPVHLDAHKLERIISNLVSNAIRHTPAGTAVVVRAWLDEDEVVVEVEDDGPGLPPELRENAFEMFVKGSGEQARRAGTGVGLGIVRQFARLMGGDATHGTGELGGLLVRVTVPDAAPAQE